MPGAKTARTVMIVVAIIVVAGLVGAMLLAPGTVGTH
jgi:preprotein translocase subunit SecG